MSATDRLVARIDGGRPAAESLALRYRALVRFAADEATDERVRASLAATSVREGARIFPLLEHRGVSVDVLDLSSLMHSRTLKSIDGCVTTAHCLARGIDRIAFESGGNTGTALTLYGRRAGLRTVCFVPTANLKLLDSAAFRDDGARLVAVDDAGGLAGVLASFAERTGAVSVPRTEWRLQAATLVGWFLLEALLTGPPYDWLVQSISAAFGPIGMYRVLFEHRDAVRLPRFLGVQQKANCPMVRAWRADQPDDGADEPLLVEVMYDRESRRFGTYESLRRILAETGGDLVAIDRSGWAARLAASGADVLAAFAKAGAPLGTRGGEICEKAGMLALVGALDAIDRGAIRPGSRVLVCLTGGTGRPDGHAVPHLRLAPGEEPPAELGATDDPCVRLA